METDPSGLSMVILFILLITYALLTAAETSARMLNRNKLRRQAEAVDFKNDRLLRFAQKLTETPSGLRACLAFVGFLSSGLGLWIFALPLATRLITLGWLRFLGDLGITWLAIVLVMTLYTLLLLVFGTLLPRRFAERNAEKTARRLRGFASFCNTVFLPMARLVNWSIRTILHAMGIDPDEEIEKLTEDEIRLLVDAGEEKGAIEETEREMIENVFEFNNLTAADAMTHRTDVWAVWIDDSPDEITRMIEETGLSRFPVYDEDLDHIIGTMSTRDFLLNCQRKEPKPLQAILRKAKFVPDSVRTDVLFRDMQHNKYHMAVVVDEYGGTSGLITMEDLIEEIVGNIYDENDPQVQQDIVDLGEGKYKVAGSLEIEIFNDETSFELPLEEDYDTIGGLILSELGSIPDEGSQPEIDFQNLHFRVLSVLDRRIEWVEISPVAKEEDELIV